MYTLHFFFFLFLCFLSSSIQLIDVKSLFHFSEKLYLYIAAIIEVGGIERKRQGKRIEKKKGKMASHTDCDDCVGGIRRT